MRYVWAIVGFLMLSSPSAAVSGGMSGGTGIGGLIQEITEEIQSLLPVKIDQDLVRRLLMRLCINGHAKLVLGNTIIDIKWKNYSSRVDMKKDQLDITVRPHSMD